MTIVQAITFAAQSIASTVAQSDQTPSPDTLNKSLSNLLDLLVPDDNKDKEAKIEKAKKMMEEEIKKGPFKVEGMSYNKPKRER